MPVLKQWNGTAWVPVGTDTSLTGPAGEDGAAATVEVGTTTTLDADSDATVSNTGTSSAAVLDFGIPKGDTGPSVLAFGFAMPGDATVRSSTAVLILPYDCTITGFRAVLGSGADTVVQLTSNGSEVGDASDGLSTSSALTTFTSSVAGSAGDVIGLDITTAGTGSDVSVMLVGTVP